MSDKENEMTATAYSYDSRNDYAQAYGFNSPEEYAQARDSYDSTGTGHHPGLCD